MTREDLPDERASEASASVARAPSAPGWPETLVKAGLAAIPIIGGVLETVVGDVAERRRERVTELGRHAVDEAGGPEALIDGVRRDERVADMLVSAAFAATESAVEEKRRAMGRAVGQAARDDAAIDESQILLRVLLDLDAPEFHILGEIAPLDGEPDDVRAAVDGVPTPVVSALIRNGVVETVGTYDGGQAVTGLTPFGRMLVALVLGGEQGR